MKDKNYYRILSKYTDEIIDLVNISKDLTTSDMQGIAMAIVMKIMTETKEGEKK